MFPTHLELGNQILGLIPLRGVLIELQSPLRQSLELVQSPQIAHPGGADVRIGPGPKRPGQRRLDLGLLLGLLLRLEARHELGDHLIVPRLLRPLRRPLGRSRGWVRSLRLGHGGEELAELILAGVGVGLQIQALRPVGLGGPEDGAGVGLLRLGLPLLLLLLLLGHALQKRLLEVPAVGGGISGGARGGAVHGAMADAAAVVLGGPDEEVEAALVDEGGCGGGGGRCGGGWVGAGEGEEPLLGREGHSLSPVEGGTERSLGGCGGWESCEPRIGRLFDCSKEGGVGFCGRYESKRG